MDEDFDADVWDRIYIYLRNFFAGIGFMAVLLVISFFIGYKS